MSKANKQTHERTNGQTNKQKYEITNAQTDKRMKEQNDSFPFEVCAFDGFKENRFIYLYLQLFKFLLSNSRIFENKKELTFNFPSKI
jgi:hypothetical protein